MNPAFSVFYHLIGYPALGKDIEAFPNDLLNSERRRGAPWIIKEENGV